MHIAHTHVRRVTLPGAEPCARRAGPRRPPLVPAHPRDEDGSLVTEYGLIAIVGATIASLVMAWASGGAIWSLFDAVTDHVRTLLGA